MQEVAHANGLDTTLGIQALQCPPALFILALYRPVHEVQVYIINIEVALTLVKSPQGITIPLVIVPHFGGDKYV
ncbi:hypothetical protein D9M69_673230 [compost metagenome]